MFKKFTNTCVTLVNKYLPDPFLFAVILTFVVVLLGLVLTGQGPMDMVKHWGSGFWGLLAFSMQMVLILVTGSAMAQAPAIRKILQTIGSTAKSPTSAVMITGFVALIACWINWGFGLVIGALLAKEMARQVKGVDYRLLIAAGYSGMVVWHGGLSGSIPLTISSAAGLGATGGALTEAVPISETVFSYWNLIITIVILAVMPFVFKAMHPEADKTVVVDPSLIIEVEPKQYLANTPAEKMENSKILWGILCVMGFTNIVYHFMTKGFDLNLNIVNFIFMFTGILLHGTLRRYIDAVIEAAKGASGIILQFPFYAGIMGMMTGLNAEGVSLAGVISNGFVSISTAATFPLFTFLSAGIVNFFVPSGGGQWAVQGPIMMPAGAALGVAPAKTAMALAWGDAWTNMIQPFWALPALGIAGLGARDIMGYCVVTLLVTGVIVAAGFLIF
ncbi:MAG: Short chain fatty acids transporter [Clostridiales bacterium 38_11]|nr:MAG: Short chain fatty acids transporter [Clostridiales bacterium 38_11]HBH12893.1 short-chain fatty acid transporter [Clostridiales bacterium]